MNHNQHSTIDSLQSQSQPYLNAYNTDSFQIDLNDPQRERLFFLSEQPIQIQIIDHELEPSLVNILHTNVYTIHIKHGPFSWSVKRKYKNFLKLYEAYALFKTKLNIRNAAHLASNAIMLPQMHDSSPNANKFKSTDHFKLFFQSIVSDFAHSKHILEKFLQDVVDHKIFRNHNETVIIFFNNLNLFFKINFNLFS